MPTISTFFGIDICMYKEAGGKHKMPHIHAYYQEYEGVFSFDGKMIEGDIPGKQRRLVKRWIGQYRSALHKNWTSYNSGGPISKIPPLQ